MSAHVALPRARIGLEEVAEADPIAQPHRSVSHIASDLQLMSPRTLPLNIFVPSPTLFGAGPFCDSQETLRVGHVALGSGVVEAPAEPQSARLREQAPSAAMPLSIGAQGLFCASTGPPTDAQLGALEALPPARDVPPSIGSQGHSAGRCKPCAFVRAAAGCKYGELCSFCHVLEEHPEAMRSRPCKGKRMRVKRQMAAIERAVVEDPRRLSCGSLKLPALIDSDCEARAAAMARLMELAAEAEVCRLGCDLGEDNAITAA